MTKTQFGFILPATIEARDEQATHVEGMNRALDLVSGHFDSFWMIDHLQEGETGMLESFTTLSYLAALFPQLKFGHTVVCQSFRNPALLAKMGATLQLLSGGRFTLGIGAGWNAEEYRAYGYDFPPARVRVEQLEETVRIVKRLWTEKEVTFSGTHYRVEGARCEPRPDPLPPIMIGGSRPKMLRLTARYADEWNVSSTAIHEYRRLVDRFEDACAEVGRDPSTVRRSWSGGCICRASQDEADRLAGARYERDEEGGFDFVGTPGRIIDQMRPFIESGVSSFMVDCGGFPDLTTLELLVDEVLPALNG